MPEGEGTYGNKVGRPRNKRTGEDYLENELRRKKKKKPKVRYNPYGSGSANPSNMAPGKP